MTRSNLLLSLAPAAPIRRAVGVFIKSGAYQGAYQGAYGDASRPIGSARSNGLNPSLGPPAIFIGVKTRKVPKVLPRMVPKIVPLRNDLFAALY